MEGASNLSEPLYKTIAQELIDLIEDETYTKGDVLPTEAKLSEKFNVSRVTIRQAIQILVELEYVRKIQGSGSHVIYSKRNAQMDRSARIISFSEEMRSIGKIPFAKIISFEMIKANANLAHDLALDIDEPLFLYERVLYGDDFPYCYERGYMPIRYFSDFTLTHLVQSKINYIENIKDYKIDYSHQVVQAILATAELQDQLRVDFNTPLVKVNHVTYNDENVPLEKTVVIFDSIVYQAHFIKKR